MITFVTFYMALSPERRHNLQKTTRSFRIADDAHCWIDLLFRSAHFFHPGCRCVLLSDNETHLPSLSGVETRRASACPDDPLRSRLRAERDFLRDSADLLDLNEDENHFVFVDFDVLINACLTPVFCDPFDVALTFRPHAEMPVNAGVVLMKAGHRNRTQALQFFDRLLHVYDGQFQDDNWWGEQRAMAHILGKEIFDSPPPRYIDAEGVRIRMLSGEIFNHTPHRSRDLANISDTVSVLHFKGKRKPMMRDYWNCRHLVSEQPRKSGARRQKWEAQLRIALRSAFNV